MLILLIVTKRSLPIPYASFLSKMPKHSDFSRFGYDFNSIDKTGLAILASDLDLDIECEGPKPLKNDYLSAIEKYYADERVKDGSQDQGYLRTTFNPRSYSVSQLRQVLTLHGVRAGYQNTMDSLVVTFNTNIEDMRQDFSLIYGNAPRGRTGRATTPSTPISRHSRSRTRSTYTSTPSVRARARDNDPVRESRSATGPSNSGIDGLLDDFGQIDIKEEDDGRGRSTHGCGPSPTRSSYRSGRIRSCVGREDRKVQRLAHHMEAIFSKVMAAADRDDLVLSKQHLLELLADVEDEMDKVK